MAVASLKKMAIVSYSLWKLESINYAEEIAALSMEAHNTAARSRRYKDGDPIVGKVLLDNSASIAKIVNKMSKNLDRYVTDTVEGALLYGNLVQLFFAISETTNYFVKYMIQPRKEDLVFCVKNICFDVDFEIDIQKTLLNILTNSNFAMMFKLKILLEECIEKDTLLSLANKALQSCTTGESTTSTGIANRYKLSGKQIRKAIKMFEEMPTIDSYIRTETFYYNRRMQQLDEYWKVVAYKGNVKILDHYLKSIDDPELRYETLMSIAHFLCHSMSTFDQQMFFYFHNNLKEEHWKYILKGKLLHILQAFLSKTKYHHYFLKAYEKVANEIGQDTFNSILELFFKILIYGKYEEVIVKKTLMDMLSVTPAGLLRGEGEGEWTGALLARLAAGLAGGRGGAARLLDLATRHMPAPATRHTLTLTILYALSMKHTNIVPQIISRIALTGVPVHFRTEFITYEVLREFLINFNKRNVFGYIRTLRKISLFVYRREGRVNTFKRKLLNDKEFIEKFMEKNWSNKNMVVMLIWLSNNLKSGSSGFIKSLCEAGTIPRLYEREILARGTTKIADMGLNTLNLGGHNSDIKRTALTKAHIRKAIMIKHFCDPKKFSAREFRREWVPLTYEDRSTFLSDLLRSEECVDALLHMVEHVEDETAECGHLDHIYHYYDLQDTLFAPLGVSAAVCERLLARGHPNTRAGGAGGEAEEGGAGGEAEGGGAGGEAEGGGAGGEAEGGGAGGEAEGGGEGGEVEGGGAGGEVEGGDAGGEAEGGGEGGEAEGGGEGGEAEGGDAGGEAEGGGAGGDAGAGDRTQPHVRRVRDYRYRILVAALHNYDGGFDLHKEEDFTDLSLTLAELAELQGPLCVFYFECPFAVVSAEPPRRLFMPQYWRPPAPRAPAPHPARPRKMSFDLGPATVHTKPLSLAPFPVPPAFTLPTTAFYPHSTSSSYTKKKPKRKLPPLRLPSPKNNSEDLSLDWFNGFKTQSKVSLPPILLPERVRGGRSGGRAARGRRSRAQLSGVRRMIVSLMQRKLRDRGGGGGAADLNRVLRVVKRPVAAWTNPRSSKSSSSSFFPSSVCEQESNNIWSACDKDDASINSAAAMLETSVGRGPHRRADASSGLLHRRYSLPETVMRKYHLAQSLSRGGSAAAAAAARQLEDAGDMRRSALTRRWRLPSARSPHSPPPPSPPLPARSLASSRCDLRRAPPRALRSPAPSPAHSPCRLHGSSEAVSPASPRSPRSPRFRAALTRQHSKDEHSPKSIEVSSDSNDRYSSKDYSDRHSSNERVETDLQTTGVQSICTGESAAVTRLVSSTDAPLDTESPGRVDTSTDSSETFTVSMPTTKEIIHRTHENINVSKPQHFGVAIHESSKDFENNDINIVPYYKPIHEYSKYEVLEIVVSETVNSTFGETVSPRSELESPERLGTQIIKNVKSNGQTINNIDIDEYVSNILVESLNSLTDQLESMNSCMGGNRKISIVEKEIKVKLQNTGVNTIVHLSPTSNNPIIFGNEELYNVDENKDSFNNNREVVKSFAIREEQASAESNNNVTFTPETCFAKTDFQNEQDIKNANDSFHTETVNKAVLQQIQKLFQDELHSLEPEVSTPAAISHNDNSNVDFYVNEHKNESKITNSMELQSHQNITRADSLLNEELLSSVGAGNYYEHSEPLIVPRFTAFPHTTSMEVNTSSSEGDPIASDCTSLVDSLDDPNSPRPLLYRNNSKDHKLVRSAIDVLSLLPESDTKEDFSREKGECFFIRINDSECECEKESIVVADHMPEKMKEKLFKRQKRREMRMECARHKRAKQLKRELEKQSQRMTKKVLNKDCAYIVDTLIDEFIMKIAQDEYKCMRIKEKTKQELKKSAEDLPRTLKLSNKSLNASEPLRVGRNGLLQSSKSEGNLPKMYKEKGHNQGKLSLPPQESSPEEPNPKRIYQKSEIHDGNKCIEILEILEYSDTSHSSPEAQSDDNQYHSLSRRKSKIPIPIHERINKIPKLKSHTYQRFTNYDKPTFSVAEAPIESCSEDNRDTDSNLVTSSITECDSPSENQKKLLEARSRSNSLRFKRIFDIIPEERSGMSVDSAPGDSNSTSGPVLPSHRDNNHVSSATSSHSSSKAKQDIRKVLNYFNAAATPFKLKNKLSSESEGGRKKARVEGVTRGVRGVRHAGTSPLAPRGEGGPPSGPRNNEVKPPDRKDLKSASTQYEDRSLTQYTDTEGKLNITEDVNTPHTIKAKTPNDVIVNEKKSTPEITKKKVKKLDEKRLAKKKADIENEKRLRLEASEMRSMSDPQLNQLALRHEGEAGRGRAEGGARRRRRCGCVWGCGGGRGGRSSSSSTERGRRGGGGGALDEQAGPPLPGVGRGGAERGAAEGWSVTVGGRGAGGAGGPQQLQMKLSFAPPPPAPPPAPHPAPLRAITGHDHLPPCGCRHCAECSCPRLPPPPQPPLSGECVEFVRKASYRLPAVAAGAGRRGSLQAGGAPCSRRGELPPPPPLCSEELCVRGARVTPRRRRQPPRRI